MRLEFNEGLVRGLLDEAIQGLVADIVREGGMIRSGVEAERLAETYAGAGLSAAEISERLLSAAAAADVLTVLCPPE